MFFSLASQRLLPDMPEWVLNRIRHTDPRRSTLSARLESLPTRDLPLEKRVRIRWNDHMVPWIEAQTDHDLAFTLGLLHAHLRTGQINFLHRLATGRLSEVFGPFALKIDHAMRIASVGQAAADIEACMPAETKSWTQRFIDGLNHHWASAREVPPEMALLRIKPEPWDMHDLITHGRLIGADFYWITMFGLLGARAKPGFDELWKRMRAAGETSTSPFAETRQAEILTEALLANNRAGSNSIAMAAERTRNGAAWIANDPHLGLGLPNLFLLAGMRSPSYEKIGLMMPGLPMIVIGRNADIAWGATNLRAASTDIYDVSDIEPERIETQDVAIKVRGGRARTRPVRRSPFGPIISDSSLLPSCNGRRLALRWVGHEASDEITALLRASTSRNPEEFRDAFASYGLTPLNILFADRSGRIGDLIAVHHPHRERFAENDLVLDARDPATHWRGFFDSRDLPFRLDPEGGMIVSANHQPHTPGFLIGWMFGVDSRKRRIENALREKPEVGMDELKAIQTDVQAPDAGALARALASRLTRSVQSIDAARIARRLKEWDGDYAASSHTAALFEIFLYHLCEGVFDERGKTALKDHMGQWSFISIYLLADLDALAPEHQQAVLHEAVTRAAADAAKVESWGQIHRMRLGHFLRNLPLIGKAFVFADLPVGGSRVTPMKTNHGLVRDRHHVGLGSMARHITDMSDLDHNWFVLLGGQDGWIGSACFTDQVQLWREQRYIRIPLRRETVEREFPHLSELEPAGSA